MAEDRKRSEHIIHDGAQSDVNHECSLRRVIGLSPFADVCRFQRAIAANFALTDNAVPLDGIVVRAFKQNVGGIGGYSLAATSGFKIVPWSISACASAGMCW